MGNGHLVMLIYVAKAVKYGICNDPGLAQMHRVDSPSLLQRWRMGQSKFTRLGNHFVILRQDVPVRVRCGVLLPKRANTLASYLRNRLRGS